MSDEIIGHVVGSEYRSDGSSCVTVQIRGRSMPHGSVVITQKEEPEYHFRNDINCGYIPVFQCRSVVHLIEGNQEKKKEIDMKKKFYILWNPESDRRPQVKFETKAEAEKVAQEMADRHRPAKFYVMECVGVAGVEQAPVKLRRFAK